MAIGAPQAIRTPWPSQPIAWRVRNHEERSEMLEAQVSAGYEFIVREVLVHSLTRAYDTNLTTEENLATTQWADAEFDLMRSCGLAVAPTEWFTFHDNDMLRTLARTAIVEGKSYPKKHKSEMSSDELILVEATEARIKHYLFKLRLPGRRLTDSRDLRQYMYGQLRNEELNKVHTPETTHCFIDTEPIVWLYRG